MRIGVDYAWGRPAADAVLAAGRTFVMRYHSTDLRTSGGVTKLLTRSEAMQLSAAGLDIVSVWEGRAADRDPLKGYPQGLADGAQALRQAASCGAPRGAVVYYAVDWDATADDLPAIGDYFDGVGAAHDGPSTVGAYGSRRVVEYVMTTGRAAYGCQTYAWSGGQWYPGAQLRQVLNNQRLMPDGRLGTASEYPTGVPVDCDEAHADQFGQWGIELTYAPDDLRTLQDYAHQVSGLPLTSLGIVGDQSHNSTGGYHVGRDVLHLLGRAPEDPGSDYSYAESLRDRAGLTNAASALDVGDFSVVHQGRQISHRNLIDAVLREVAKPGHGRAADIREMIYESPEESGTIKRWDALGVRNTGDSTHRVHTHFSFFRDAEGRRAGTDNMLGLMRSAFEPAAVAPLTPSGDDDMGASFPPRDIPQAPAFDSACIPPVQSGAADPRPAWLNVCNDTNAAKYRLRVWASKGDGQWFPVGTETVGGNAGYVTLNSGQRWSVALPKGTAALHVSRAALDGADAKPYMGPLTWCLERGPVGA
jgi:hypothetical protein